MSKTIGNITIGAANLFGGSSLLLLCMFLYLGPWVSVDLNLSTFAALGFDAVLCSVFFLQHSGMIRKSFQRKLGAIVPGHYHGAIFAIASGVVLIALILFWQPSHQIVAIANGPLRWILRGAFFLAILGFVWGVRSLGSFDVFGARPIKAEMYDKAPRELPLTIRGPYRWIRHPLYFFFLVLLWSNPEITADRLLLNSSWTVWIFVGSVLEERDLVSEFGGPYKEYQKQVPMLIPYRLPRQT